MNFKTRIVRKDTGQYNSVISKRLKKFGETPIFYCKRNMIDKIWVSEESANKIIYKRCPYYNIVENNTSHEPLFLVDWFVKSYRSKFCESRSHKHNRADK